MTGERGPEDSTGKVYKVCCTDRLDDTFVRDDAAMRRERRDVQVGSRSGEAEKEPRFAMAQSRKQACLRRKGGRRQETGRKRERVIDHGHTSSSTSKRYGRSKRSEGDENFQSPAVLGCHADDRRIDPFVHLMGWVS